MNPTPSPYPKPAPAFEHVACSRCGGSGEYSYCQSYGTRCFKCHGRGWTLTARGQAAMEHCTALRSVPVESLQIGQTVRVELMHALSGASVLVWREVAKVEQITEANANAWSLTKDPVTGAEVRAAIGLGHYRVTCERAGEMGICTMAEPGKLFRVPQTAEQKTDTLAKALAYQATLTVKGEPRKAKGRKCSP